jgi:TRAP transporter 4TM/12TM fusion protein
MMLFGGLFGAGAGGSVLIDIGLKAGSKAKDNSAPAKAAVISSCLFGMISGSASANVASTGVFTIPMMKKVGYSPEEAGAVEAAASTGGQIMPPVMGTAAFLMADMLEINYLTIATAALIPGLIYYASLFLLVHLLAKKRVNRGEYVTVDPQKMEPILPRLIGLLPVVSMLGAMALGFTIQRAALYAILTVLVVNFLGPKKYRNSIVQLFKEIMTATQKASVVCMPLCGCGIVIGILTMSGLASRLSAVITSMGGDFLWVGLIITMIGCILLGMALPTTASYLMGYVLFLPTLRGIGIPILPANLFIFYFGIFAQVTPPVCMATYTAAGIAGGNFWKTGWTAFSFVLVAIFAPYVFVYQPGILLIGTLLEIIHSTGILIIGTFFLTLGVSGYFLAPISKLERTLFVIAGILVCIPETISDIVGLVIGVALVVLHIITWKTHKNQQVAVQG